MIWPDVGNNQFCSQAHPQPSAIAPCTQPRRFSAAGSGQTVRRRGLRLCGNETTALKVAGGSKVVDQSQHHERLRSAWIGPSVLSGLLCSLSSSAAPAWKLTLPATWSLQVGTGTRRPADCHREAGRSRTPTFHRVGLVAPGLDSVRGQARRPARPLGASQAWSLLLGWAQSEPPGVSGRCIGPYLLRKPVK